MKILARVVFLLTAFSPFSWSEAATVKMVDSLDTLLNNNIVRRDSGQEVTKGFLSECLSDEGPERYLLKCDDVLFDHHISYFENVDDSSTIILITQDGASVENRWVFKAINGNYIDVKEDVWPTVTAEMISKCLVKETGNSKYTAKYILRSAHSNYRVEYGPGENITVVSGTPDESYGIELGSIKWNGREFKFVPKSS